MRTLITGGAGFIGSHLCERFLAEGHDLVCLDNFITGNPANVQHLQANPRFTFLRHNISNHVEIDGPIDNILHFASPASPVDYLQHPIPTPLRCWKLGQAVRRAVLSYPEDLDVLVVGTGGLSHQMNGERGGFNNEKWDLKFLDLIADNPKKLTEMRHADYIRLGGTEGAEEIMWLAMRGALSPRVKKIHQSYYLPMTTAMAVALFE